MHPKFRVLSLGTRSSERSIFAEFLLRSVGGDRVDAYSAGETPTGEVYPLVLKILREDFDIDTTGAAANSWQEYAGLNFDFVITLSDDARERSPTLPGAPVCAHWSIDDPMAFEGTEEEKHERFLQAAFQIKRRLELFNCLPIEKLDHLQRAVHTRQVHEHVDKRQTDRITSIDLPSDTPMNSSASPDQELFKRIYNDLVDSFDEELEMEVGDGMLPDWQVPVTPVEKETAKAERRQYFRELFRTQGELVKLLEWVGRKGIGWS